MRWAQMRFMRGISIDHTIPRENVCIRYIERLLEKAFVAKFHDKSYLKVYRINSKRHGQCNHYGQYVARLLKNGIVR